MDKSELGGQMVDDGDASVLLLASKVLSIELSFDTCTNWTQLSSVLATIPNIDGTGEVLKQSETVVIGPHVVVGYGAQDAILWAIEGDDERISDPKVFVGENDDLPKWELQFEKFSDFAATFFLWKAVNLGKPISGCKVSGVKKAAKGLDADKLGVAPFAGAAGLKFYSDRESFIACVAGTGLYATAISELAWEKLSTRLKLKWDYCSLDG